MFAPLCHFIAPAPPSRTTQQNGFTVIKDSPHPRPHWDMVEQKNQDEESAASTKKPQR